MLRIRTCSPVIIVCDSMDIRFKYVSCQIYHTQMRFCEVRILSHNVCPKLIQIILISDPEREIDVAFISIEADSHEDFLTVFNMF